MALNIWAGTTSAELGMPAFRSQHLVCWRAARLENAILSSCFIGEENKNPNRSPMQQQSLSAGGRGQCLHTHSNYEHKQVKFVPDVLPAVFGVTAVANWVSVR